VNVTVLPVPIFLVSNVALPATIVTVSLPMIPLSEPPVVDATVLPSYSLSFALSPLIVKPLAVIFAVTLTGCAESV